MMKTTYKITQRLTIKAAMFLLALFCLLLAVIIPNEQGRYAVNAASGDVMTIHKFHAVYTVNEDRTVNVVETIRVEFLENKRMFYHALPKDNTRYTDISATCEGNEEFYFYVADNPDISGFLDINCVGGAQAGNTWEYKICYTMQHFGGASRDGMMIDLVGLGSSVPLHNVQVTVHFPANSQLQYTVYSGTYGAEGNDANVQVFQPDSTTLILSADTLDRVYQSRFDEYMAEGITLDFTLGDGVLQSVAKVNAFTENGWWIALVCAIVCGLSIVVAMLLPKREEIITSVNVSAPDEMDPMLMGKRLDGIIDNEDVTSMLYYFAHKGYLHIDLTDEDDPLLIRKIPHLPDSEPAHARTLFEGLFKKANQTLKKDSDEPQAEQGECSIRVSKLKGNFYESVALAKEQVVKMPQYNVKSILYYVLGGILGVLTAFLLPFAVGARTIGGYVYVSGLVYTVGILGVLLLGYLKENYRYKWKNGTKLAVLFAQILIAVLFGVIFIFGFATHLMTRWEKLLLSAAVFVCTFATSNKLNRTDEKREMLGKILGFKDFIVYTEEDKIKFMLEENPELFYKILPYAQVLGVTDEWEDKFKNITLQPPTWCAGTHMSYFDYVLLRSAMRSAMVTAMTQPQKGGSFIGKGGGGGSFGGFSGGGFGGGGFGAR